MGGEEFSVVLINCDTETAFLKAEQFRKQVESFPIIIEDNLINVNVSIGVSSLKDELVTLDTIINRADHALYNAKDQGRNKTVIWS